MKPRKHLALWTSWSKVGLDHLASVPFTLSNLALAMALIAAGTLAQIRLGSFEAQKHYFNSWWVWSALEGRSYPVFPGGLTIGALWFANLSASFITRFRWARKDLGLWVTHAGLLVLLAGQFLTQSLARESQMPLPVGESSNYSESPRSTELVVIKTSDPTFDIVTTIPERFYLHEGDIHAPRLPFSLTIKRFYRNAQLRRADSGERSEATRGVGPSIAIQEIPPLMSDDLSNTPAALVEVREGDRPLGVWLVSSGLGAPQSFLFRGDTYQIGMRAKRYYFPFTLTLKEFHHDTYPGTDIPKNFSSVVQLTDPSHQEDREVLIYMNHPLRYQGKTFYQASFGEGDTLSVFQVVDNPASMTPYIACGMIILGLLIQFLSHMIGFLRKRT